MLSKGRAISEQFPSTPLAVSVAIVLIRRQRCPQSAACRPPQSRRTPPLRSQSRRATSPGPAWRALCGSGARLDSLRFSSPTLADIRREACRHLRDRRVCSDRFGTSTLKIADLGPDSSRRTPKAACAKPLPPCLDLNPPQAFRSDAPLLFTVVDSLSLSHLRELGQDRFRSLVLTDRAPATSQCAGQPPRHNNGA
jgi:hypothetical protein